MGSEFLGVVNQLLLKRRAGTMCTPKLSDVKQDACPTKENRAEHAM